MEGKQINKVLSVSLLVIIIAFLGLFIFKGPILTGIVVYEETINTLNWTFDDLNDFSYDNSLINLNDGEAKLVKTTVEYTWNVEDLIDISVISAEEYEPNKTIKDRTSKIQSLDGDSVNINGDKDIFDITFDSELSNNDIISIYIIGSGNGNTDVYLCDNGTFCSEPGYGLVNFNGNEGWHNITISGLDEPKNKFNINPSENIGFDYIKAIHIDITTHESVNISYPESASIETNDFNIISLSSFLNFHKNDLLNSQDISYYYSTDSGNSWSAMPSDNDLSGVSVSSGKLKIKAELSKNDIETPVIYDFAVSYSTQTCNENWNLTYSECLSNNTKLKYYLDKNECSTINDLPADNGTYETCIYDNGTISATNFVIDNQQESNVLLEVETKSGVPSVSISITNYSTNSKNSSPSLKELGKYLDIVADTATKQNLSSITIKMYYTDEEIANANLDEETLQIHYFNETSNQWQTLNSTVNASGNYVEVTIDHLSTFGIFGEEKPSESPSSSGGGKSKTIPKKVPETDVKPVETETVPEVKEETIEEPEEKCNYKISVLLAEHISLVESDYVNGTVTNIGNCKIENLDIKLDENLESIIRIENERIETIDVGESVEFSLFKKQETSKADNLQIQGFNIKTTEKNIETYSGSLIFGAVVQEESSFEEIIDIRIDLSKPPSTIDMIKSKIPLLSALFLLVLILFYIRYKKRKVI